MSVKEKIDYRIEQLIQKLVANGKRYKTPPAVVVRDTKTDSRIVYDKVANIAYMYVNTNELKRMLPITRQNLIRRLIINIVQKMYYGDCRDRAEFRYIQRMYA